MATFVIPFHVNGKTRLGDQQLARAMLADVQDAAREAIVVDSPGGQGAALAAALADLTGPVTIVNSDLPCATAAELDELAASAPALVAAEPERITAASSSPMIALAGGAFDMTIRHPRRECGCVAFGTTHDATWGWFYKDLVTHAARVEVRPFAIRPTAATNAEFVAFVHAASYRPKDPERFLKHIARAPDGSLPLALSAEQAELPVTFVSLADARAYAAWHGERLPTEAEWQWAAEGAGRGRRYPWGDDARTFPARLRAALDPTTATAQGVTGLSGNAWELTESEHTDGHTRFVLLRGGVYLPPGESEWLAPRGAHPNDHHAKYVLLSDGLDRSEAISFRTVRSI